MSHVGGVGSYAGSGSIIERCWALLSKKVGRRDLLPVLAVHRGSLTPFLFALPGKMVR